MNNGKNNGKGLSIPLIVQEDKQLIVPAYIDAGIPEVKDTFMEMANRVMNNEEATSRVIYYNENQDRGVVAGNIGSTRQSILIEKVGEGVMTTSTVFPIGDEERAIKNAEEVRGKKITQDMTAIMVPNMSQTKISNNENKK